MRGTEQVQDSMFSYISAEQRVPKDHPLRPVREIMDECLKGLSREFEGMYSTTGRPSIARSSIVVKASGTSAARNGSKRCRCDGVERPRLSDNSSVATKRIISLAEGRTWFQQVAPAVQLYATLQRDALVGQLIC